MKKFLTAKWQDLVMANYVVDPELLAPIVPKGTELDTINGKCFVSLVAFKFVNTVVRGFKIPYHRDFEEVNLRYYIKRSTGDETRSAVAFIKEIVPRAAITFVAKTVYGEPYETWSMSHERNGNELTYLWSKDDVENRVHVEISRDLGIPPDSSEGSFIIEHYWGYTNRGSNRTDEYKVEHPKWSLFEVNYAEIDVDFGATYGDRFSFLSKQAPDSIFMAKGSPVIVYQGEKVEF